MLKLNSFLRKVRRNQRLTLLFYPYYRLKSFQAIRNLKIKKDSFLENSTGLIHVGGHTGQESLKYAKFNLPVIWVEANPEAYIRLLANLRGIPKQKAFLGLIGRKNLKRKKFYLSNNDGASSSIFPLEKNKSLWPDLHMEKKIYLKQYNLLSFLKKLNISLKQFDTLILDVQGGELEILKGIQNLQKYFRKIQLEASNFSFYKGAPQIKELNLFLHQKGYKKISEKVFAKNSSGQKYMDCRYCLPKKAFKKQKTF